MKTKNGDVTSGGHFYVGEESGEPSKKVEKKTLVSDIFKSGELSTTMYTT